MTNQEAIKMMQNASSNIKSLAEQVPVYKGDLSKIREALDMAIATLEKQEPKSPTEISWEYDYFKCPSCGKLITSTTGIDTHKYCLECGQALKFTEGTE